MPRYKDQFETGDFEPLKDFSDSLVKKASVENKLKLSEHRDRFIKIALDLFRDNDSDYVWKVVKEDGGEEFIVRTAQKYAPTVKQGAWSAEIDKRGDCVTLAYRGTPVFGFKRANLEIETEDMYDFRQHVANKANSDLEFVEQIKSQLPEERLSYLKEKYPELF